MDEKGISDTSEYFGGAKTMSELPESVSVEQAFGIVVTLMKEMQQKNKKLNTKIIEIKDLAEHAYSCRRTNSYWNLMAHIEEIVRVVNDGKNSKDSHI